MNHQVATRRHDIDALRAFAFGLLILYHVAMLYVAEWEFHLKSAYQAEWLQLPMQAVNRWRMPLIFLISGLAVHFLRKHGTPAGEFAVRRTVRLLVPLVFGMALIVPVQPYLQTLSQGLIEPGFGAFLLRYWSGRGFPPQAYVGAELGWTWNHLWYLVYLLAYTLTLCGLFRVLESPAGARLRARLLALRGNALLLAPATPFMLYAWTLQDRFPQTHAFIDDWHAHAVYFSAFLYGYWLGTDAGLWRELGRLRWQSLGYALVLLATYLAAIELWLPDDAPRWQINLVRPLRWLYMWAALATILGWAYTHLNRPFRWLRFANESVYPWYLLHQSLIIPLAYFLARLQLGPFAEPLLVLTGTIVGCLVIHLVVRKLGPLGILFGMPRAGRSPAMHAARPPLPA